MGPDVIGRLPWNIVWLFGGGFALAQGFQVTGLAAFIGQQFTGLAGVPPLVIVFATCLGLTFLTELTSNAATTEMVRVGLVLNLIGAVVITVVSYFVGTSLFGIEPGVLPDWAMTPPARP